MHRHDSTTQAITAPGHLIALVGNPNVGKSALFQRLTGQRVTISNYPGTTVEVLQGKLRVAPEIILVDTPGVITFPSNSEDEEVTERVLFNDPLQAILQVGDAKNLRRTLILTIQLVEMGLPLVLALNMIDEADARGVIVDYAVLEQQLAIPVIPTAATRGRGILEVTRAIQSPHQPQFNLCYPSPIEAAMEQITPLLPATAIHPRALGLFWLSSDKTMERWLKPRITIEQWQTLCEVRSQLATEYTEPISSVLQQTRQEAVEHIAQAAILKNGAGWRSPAQLLGYLTTHPLWGLPILGIILTGLYLFVGIFGAGILVRLLEENLFAQHINPWLIDLVNRSIPFTWLSDLITGPYGLWTMGMTYALALVLPIVSTFFLAFGVLEDSGYLPRLAAFSNRLFVFLGLNGRAVLPMVLGLGCVTMATLTTRVMETRRERLLVTLLLALAIPCSAQLGLVMGLLAHISLTATLIWSGMVLLVLFIVGWLAAKVLPGERSRLLVELPPLRLPQVSNVVVKTLARLEWYIKEVIPLFLLGAFMMYLLDKSGILSWLINAGEPLVKGWLGLPAEASAAFLMGFIRRDFGATGFFVMEHQGLLTPAQVVVAMVTITLFIPCIASVMMITKERGWKIALGMMAFIIPVALFSGGLLYRILQWIGWGS
jgi:ferrous iron transport protein B